MRSCICNIVGQRHGAPNVEHDITRENHLRYAETVGAEYRVEVIEIGDDLSCCWWKWKASDIAADYDVTLFLDNDCVVTKKCPAFQEAVPSGHWGAVDELPRYNESSLKTNADWAGKRPEEMRLSLNGGVLIMPTDAKRIYYPDYETVTVNWVMDQILLSNNLHAGKAPYRRLDRRWNWSFVSFIDFLSGRDQAYIIHHAARGIIETPRKKNLAIARDVEELGV